MISSVTPTEAKAGETITISGSGFGANKASSIVTVSGAAADTIISWSDTEIQAVVPEGGLTGPVKAKVEDKDSDEKHLVVLWDKENPDNVVIPGNHASPLQMQIIAEGVGGSILVWNDFRSYDPTAEPRQVHVYAQRLNSRGKTIWNSDGVPLSPIAGMQFFPQLVSDGNGGAIVVWQETRTNWSDTNDIYAQRIGPSGTVLWQSPVAVCTADHAQEKPKIISDGAGGAIIVWQDNRSGSRFDIYAQRINGDGVAQWTAGGVAISTANSVYPYNLPFEIVADDAGGAIIAWTDKASGSWMIKAQKINGSGNVAWTAEGVAASTTTTTQYVSRPVPDGSGGAIMAWTSSSGDLYTQRINANGSLQWGTAGVVISAATSAAGTQVATDGSGGAIITWEDCRSGSATRDIYAQRVNASGIAQWTANGVPVCVAAEAQYGPQIISDGKNGAIITWYDYRNYSIQNSNGVLQGADTFAQRISSSGTALWQADGIAISAADLHQMYPKIVTDNSGGAIIIWEDSRSGSAVDIYAQGISTSGRQ